MVSSTIALLELLAKYFQPMPLTPYPRVFVLVIDQRAVICLLLPAPMPAATLPPVSPRSLAAFYSA